MRSLSMYMQGVKTVSIQLGSYLPKSVRCVPFKQQSWYHSGSVKPASQYNTSKPRVIDLRSDTITKPEPGMRQAMADAEVGDDVYNEDPTVNELQRRCAELFGTESALFVPTGTMGNLLSILVHCNERGSEAVVGHKSHILLNEQGGIAQFAGVNPRTIDNKADGTFDLDALQKLIRPLNDFHQPRTKMICLENSHNFCGGIALPMEFLKEVWDIAQENDIRVHTDGARILNSAVALDVPVCEIMKYSDSVNMCFSKGRYLDNTYGYCSSTKGLAAPVGSIIAGSKDYIDMCLRLRKPLGGGLRQAGVLAAAALYSLDHIVPKLGVDNERAKTIGLAVKGVSSNVVHVPNDGVGTNMVMLEMKKPGLTAAEFSQRLMQVTPDEEKSLGECVVVRSVPIYPFITRIVTHNDLDQEMVDHATKKLLYVVKEYGE